MNILFRTEEVLRQVYCLSLRLLKHYIFVQFYTVVEVFYKIYGS